MSITERMRDPDGSLSSREYWLGENSRGRQIPVKNLKDLLGSFPNDPELVRIRHGQKRRSHLKQFLNISSKLTRGMDIKGRSWNTRIFPLSPQKKEKLERERTILTTKMQEMRQNH